MTSFVPSLAEIRAKLAECLAKRPDHLAALHPLAPKTLRDEFATWSKEHQRLRTLEGMALTAERSGWKDANGNPVKPAYWGKGEVEKGVRWRKGKAA